MPPRFAGGNFCSEILVSANGRFVYAGNRLHDIIAIFSVGRDGTLAISGKNGPMETILRGFNVVPGGRSFYCCNQRAEVSAVFRVDHQTGGLEFTGSYFASAILRASFFLIWRNGVKDLG